MISRTNQYRFWLLALAAFGLALWVLKPMLLPFIAGMAIAYLLNPVVNGISGRRMPRWLGTLLVLLSFVLAVVLVLLLILPLVQGQIGALIEAMPGYIDSFRTRVLPWVHDWMARLSTDDAERLREAAGQYAGSAAGWLGDLLRNIISKGFALFDVLTLLVITPVVAFYMLRDWPRLTQTIDHMLPRKHYGVIRQQFHDIDRTLSGFVRGQALVCLSLGLIYSIGLTLVGLNYGATIGIIAGVLSFIPYLGSTFVLITSLALAFAQFDSALSIGLVMLVFLIGQSLEGYVLTPKLVGDRVGLHPVWILFAIFAGGTLMGFAGVLIAVPVAAVIGVLIRFALRQYKASALYASPE